MPAKAEEMPLKKKARKQRNRSTTKSQLIKKSVKTAHTVGLKLAKELKKEGKLTTSDDGASDSDGDNNDYTDSPISHRPYLGSTITFKQKKQKRIRKDFWADQSPMLKKWYLESYNNNGHADPTLKTSMQLKESYKCNCSDKKTMEIYCYMLHSK